MMAVVLIATCILQAASQSQGFKEIASPAFGEAFFIQWQATFSTLSKILIFSMVGVAAAITEMLVNRKDQKLYHKLGFLLRIAL
mmetsp:Transcript_64128/g.102128  ORF Transcript_64128/g.102128 Transcript_64128/m.102128 type:complete len:84 (-) Transcript_64128:93-344(-)